MKKKVLIGFLLLTLVFLTGCGNREEETEEKNNSNEVIENKEESNTNNEEEHETVMTEDYELYTDDKKLVFKDGNTYSIYYYSGTKITGYHTYTDYETEESATEALTNYQKLKNVDRAYTKGRYLVLEYNKSEYKNLTVYKVRSAYGDLEQLPDK